MERMKQVYTQLGQYRQTGQVWIVIMVVLLGEILLLIMRQCHEICVEVCTCLCLN
jgi:hypothetical protein